MTYTNHTVVEQTARCVRGGLIFGGNLIAALVVLTGALMLPAIAAAAWGLTAGVVTIGLLAATNLILERESLGLYEIGETVFVVLPIALLGVHLGLDTGLLSRDGVLACVFALTIGSLILLARGWLTDTDDDAEASDSSGEVTI